MPGSRRLDESIAVWNVYVFVQNTGVMSVWDQTRVADPRHFWELPGFCFVSLDLIL